MGIHHCGDREGWRLIDRGKPYEHVRCGCKRWLVNDHHARCRGCQRPRPCDARGWRVCAVKFAGCGPYGPDCPPSHRHA